MKTEEGRNEEKKGRSERREGIWEGMRGGKGGGGKGGRDACVCVSLSLVSA